MANQRRMAAIQAGNLNWLIGAVQKLAEAQGVELDPLPTRIVFTRPPLGEEPAEEPEAEEEEVTESITLKDGVDDREATTAGKALQRRKKKG